MNKNFVDNQAAVVGLTEQQLSFWGNLSHPLENKFSFTYIKKHIQNERSLSFVWKL